MHCTYYYILLLHGIQKYVFFNHMSGAHVPGAPLNKRHCLPPQKKESGGLWECLFFTDVASKYHIYASDVAARSHLYDIYIYAYLKQFIHLGDKKQNILHMHSEKLNNAINGSMSFSQWISERKFNFALLRHAQMIGSWTRGNSTFDWQKISFCPQAVLHLPDRAPYIKRYGMFCKGKHIVPLKNVVLLNPSTASTQILRATACCS